MKLHSREGKTRRPLRELCAALLFVTATSVVQAFPGQLDTSFGCATPGSCSGIAMTGIPPTSGIAAALSMALQSDGKIVLAGSAGSGSGANFAVARFNSNGTLDTTFNSTGANTIAVGSGDDHANAVAVQGDGKIVVAGGAFISFVWNFALTRFNANGTADATFSPKTTTIGSTYNEAYAVAITPTGAIVMAGKAGDTPATDFGLVRYTSAGNLDTSFAGTGKVRTVMPFTCSGGCVGQAQAIDFQPDGKMIVAGWSGPLGNADFILARYNSNGTLDTTFGTNGVKVHAISGGNDEAFSVKVITLPDSTQRILAAGITNPSGSKANYAIARYLTSGAVDTAFGTNGVVTTSISGGNDVPTAVTVDAAGNVVVGGDQNDLAGDFVVARYTPNGVRDNTFGCATPGSCLGYAMTNLSGTDQGKGVAVQPDGNIVVGGTAAAGTSSAKFAAVRYLGGSTPPPGATALAVTSVNGGNPVSAGVGFSVVAQSLNAAGAPTNVASATAISFTLSTGTGPLNGTAACTIAAGSSTCTASGLTLTTAQSGARITASGGSLTPGVSGSFAVVAGTATNLLVSGFPASSAAGTPGSFQVRARDAYNNTASGYTGTVRFASTDGEATLPANYAFTGGDAGVHTFSATLKTAGTWSISATDTVNASIAGSQGALGVTPGSPSSLTVVSGSPQSAGVNTNFAAALVASLKDAYGNVIPGLTVSFTAPASGAGATFGGSTTTSAVTDANGYASSGTAKANLTSGSYTVAATYGALPAANFSLTNSKVGSSTTVALTSGATPAPVNTSLTFTATVSGTAGTPTGSATFVADGATTLCSNVSLNASGQASCTVQSLTAAAHSITAQYSGNVAYNGSTSSALSQQTSKQTPNVTISSTNPNPSGVNAAVTVNYSVASSPSGPIGPTGNVTVSDGGSVSCTASAAAGSCSLTFTTSGAKSLTANYVGDSNFNSDASPAFAHTVNSVVATVNLSANPSSVTVGQTTTITATVSGSQGTPTGTVAVSGAGGNCTITLSSGTGNCVLTTSTIGISQTITGNYSGNGTYGTSSGTTSVSVSNAVPSVAISVNPTSIAVGGTTTVTATVSGSAGTPTGTVAVNGAGGNCTVTLASGTGTCTLAGNNVGSNQTVSGSYSGDAKYTTASGSTQLTVTTTGATVALSANPTTVNLGGGSTITATVSGGQGTPTGSVSVSGAGGSCSITLASGTGQCNLVASTAGAGQVITGNYSGNATYGATSGTTTLNVNKATPTVSLSANPTSVGVGGTTTITATVSSGAGTPTGTVAVSGAGGSCSITLASGTGNCVLTASTTGSGQTITGNYSGNSNFNAASGTTTLNVSTTGATVGLSANPTSITIGGTSTITATVSGGQGTPTGTVAVSGAGGSCSITLSGGTGNCVLTGNTAGASQTITGNYSGNGTYGASSGTTTLTVNKATPSVNVSVNPTTINQGSTTTATATVSGSVGTPTGTVSVSGAGGNCTVTLSSGTGTCVLTGNTAGAAQTITGNYSGDAKYNTGSDTATLTVNGAGATVTLSANPTTVQKGQASTITATVAGSQGTPTGSVSVTGAGGACTITLSSGTGSCSLTTSTVGAGQTITGNYGGNGTYPASSGTTTLSVTKINPLVTVAVSPGSTTVLNPVQASATVSGAAGTPTGTVSVSGAGGSCMITLNNGSGACNLVPTVSGNGQTVVGPYSGDANYMAASDTTMINVHGNGTPPALDLDLDGGPVDALTDGAILMRYLNGVRGAALTAGALSSNAQQTDPTTIANYLTSILAQLDVDGSGGTTAGNDGLLIVRYLMGFRGEALLAGAKSGGSNLQAVDIEANIAALVQ